MKKGICIILTLWLTICVSDLNAFDFGDIVNSRELINTIIPKEKDRKFFEAFVQVGKPEKYIDYNGNKIQSDYENPDDRRTKNEAVAIYTAGGAALGASLGQILGKDTESTLLGTGAGIIVGSLYGNYKGNEAVKDKKRIDKKRKLIKQKIENIEKANNEIRDYNKNLCSEINRLKNFSKAEFKRNLKKAKAQYVEAKGLCNMANAKLKDLEKLKNEYKSNKLDIQIAKLKKEISSLETQTEQLASLDKRIRV